jgi:hypothetical protein
MGQAPWRRYGGTGGSRVFNGWREDGTSGSPVGYLMPPARNGTGRRDSWDCRRREVRAQLPSARPGVRPASSTPNRPLGCHPRRCPAHRRQHRQVREPVRHQKLPAAFSGPARGILGQERPSAARALIPLFPRQDPGTLNWGKGGKKSLNRHPSSAQTRMCRRRRVRRVD